ncbi:MAG: polyphosphate kinase 1 [Gemmatimonadetes bacterium]|nr:polyphosphate kinase 1 [Gemmatimonadota bacterium]
MTDPEPDKLFDRELSWIAFNGRVLQEAQDPNVPLFERLSFLSIVSSNLDEFFRVRVAALRTLLRLGKKRLKKLGVSPQKLLLDIHAAVHNQQEAFGQTLRGEVLPALAAHGVELLDEGQVPESAHDWLAEYFDREVAPRLLVLELEGDDGAPFLEDRRTYLAVTLWGRSGVMAEQPTTRVIRVPPELPRFVALGEKDDAAPEVAPGVSRTRKVMFIDDVIRFNLSRLFPDYLVDGAYAVKLSRDADLYLEDEFSGDLAVRIRKALAKRDTGLPSRFLYDPRTPYATVAKLKERLGLADEDLMVGGRYHGLSDLRAFPDLGMDEHKYDPLEPLRHPGLDGENLLERVEKGDHLLHLPYQSFEYVERFLTEAADDPAVEEIWASLYRVASDSVVARALIRGAKAGKAVTAVVEVQARFDEASNLAWADQMEAAGVRVIFTRLGLKMHAKLLLVGRREGSGLRRFAYIGTGNFNESTARFYTDLGLFTSRPYLSDEVRQVFSDLVSGEPSDAYEHLLVAPLGLRRGFEALVRREIAEAKAGRPARMILKMNSLEDPGMVSLLLEASDAGVDVDLIVRGICCLRTAGAGVGRLRVRSIVDRFLEHSRVYAFHHGGRQKVYLASADWMIRNLNRRVEVAVPVEDEALRDEVLSVLDLQLRDNVKARWIDRDQTNPRVTSSGPQVRSQMAHYEWLKARGTPAGSG